MNEKDEEDGCEIGSNACWKVISSDKITKAIPLLQRVGKDDYATQYLPSVQSSISSILKGEKQTRIKFQDIYSCVYKGVMSCHSDDLLVLLVTITKAHLNGLAMALQLCSVDDFLPAFSVQMHQYFASCESLIAVFAYLDRAYVTVEKRSSLSNVLLYLFYDGVVKPCKIGDLIKAAIGNGTYSELISTVQEGLLKIEATMTSDEESVMASYKIIYGSNLNRKRTSSFDNDRPRKKLAIR